MTRSSSISNELAGFIGQVRLSNASARVVQNLFRLLVLRNLGRKEDWSESWTIEK